MKKIQNFFRQETVFTIFLDDVSTVTINLFDGTGKKILSVIEKLKLSAGKQEIKISQNQISSGIYTAKIYIENLKGKNSKEIEIIIN
ncbi:hypothetical protein [Chryseobacterium luquanense]|uniref:Secretion system C-terminal sorting domain-containing protein n=1 Tax=Chryseobacterium luquanense TaxID=2983766 RepID=A0ABT3Y1H0_9FLAO|nr:hypothetical protein [Chryseobacterium luquanense]MCX8531986.1 hypothetical protein [Chryseobacterium luquanense]